ncbi:MAG: hypothetical protein H5T71_03260 [Chloroflexi bacterium]|nr:hypothetical protein [Chloroflexota bacterium]
MTIPRDLNSREHQKFIDIFDQPAVLQALARAFHKPFASMARGAGSNQASGAYDADNFSRATLIVDLTAVNGSPTSFSLDVKLQMSPDEDGDRWVDVPNGAITTITSSPATAMVFDKPITGARRVRAVYTLSFTGGTNPTATFEVDLALSQV